MWLCLCPVQRVEVEGWMRCCAGWSVRGRRNRARAGGRRRVRHSQEVVVGVGGRPDVSIVKDLITRWNRGDATASKMHIHKVRRPLPNSSHDHTTSSHPAAREKQINPRERVSSRLEVPSRERRARVAMPARHEMTQLAEAVEEDEDDVVPRATCLWVEIDSTPFFSVHQQGNPPGMAMAKKDGRATLRSRPSRSDSTLIPGRSSKKTMFFTTVHGDCYVRR
mmetsp:Transcript_11397/g.26547  ORF Transcript_11397/g.26547 Transcript_11397/m.26547 type:complete len:222 (+) Transcript_11397:1152-1817(+)